MNNNLDLPYQLELFVENLLVPYSEDSLKNFGPKVMFRLLLLLVRTYCKFVISANSLNKSVY